jgi:hypothetical protein
MNYVSTVYLTPAPPRLKGGGVVSFSQSLPGTCRGTLSGSGILSSLPS